MAHYSYKLFCYDIDYDTFEKYVERLKKEYGENGFDENPNYDGGYWEVAALWMTDVLAENKELKEQLELCKENK